MYYLSCAFACENKTVDVEVLTIHDSTFFQCRHMKGLLLTVLFRLLFLFQVFESMTLARSISNLALR